MHPDAPSEQPISRKKKRLFTVLLVLLNLFVFTALYLGSIVWRCTARAGQHIRWTGNPYHLDKNYGYFPRSHELAYHSLKYGEPIPVIFDENGFRIPPGATTGDDESPASHILFLGGSFTHGYGVPAEKTFAHLTATALDASAMNAGASGWGLSQMVLRARDVIPRLKPDLVVVQYSAWLPERSLNFYRPSRRGKSPAPYFYEAEGGMAIHQPVFESINFTLPFAAYSQKDFLSYLWHVGIPLYIHDDFLVLRTALKRGLGLLPPPVSSRQKAVDFAYQEILDLCHAHDARMLILVIPAGTQDDPKDRLEAFSGRIVHTMDPLKRRLPQPTEQAWAREYRIWRGNPPELVDGHPSIRMHAVIAERLIEAIRALDVNNESTTE